MIGGVVQGSNFVIVVVDIKGMQVMVQNDAAFTSNHSMVNQVCDIGPAKSLHLSAKYRESILRHHLLLKESK